MKSKAQVVTSLPVAPEVERRSRMIKYTVAMTVRTICLIVGAFSTGWVMWIAFAGAIFLPYIAVVLANSADHSAQSKVTAPVIAPALKIEASAFKVADDEQPKA